MGQHIPMDLPGPEPQDCACSKGVNVGTGNTVPILEHCMGGQLQCAVLPASG